MRSMAGLCVGWWAVLSVGAGAEPPKAEQPGATQATATRSAKASAEWPAWRGPTGDGLSPEVPRTMPIVKFLWRKEMAGICHAGPSAARGVVIAGDYDTKNDLYRCYEARTGKELWTYSVPNARKMDYGPAPRASPLICKDKVICLGAFGDLHCVSLKTGRRVWQKDFSRDFGSGKPPTWGHCSSPLLADGKVIVRPGGKRGTLVALSPDSGQVLWAGPGAGPNYAGLIAATFAGVRQIVAYDSKNLVGWDLSSGKVLWSLEIDTTRGYTVPAPLAVKGKLVTSTEDECTRLFAFDKEGRIIPQPEALNEDLAPEIATPVACGRLLLGSTDGLICLDLDDKLKTLWIEEDAEELLGMLHIVAWRDRALIFNDEGTMLLVAPERKGCRILGKAKLCKSTWSHPALANGKVFIRDKKHLYCYELRMKAAAGAASHTARRSDEARR